MKIGNRKCCLYQPRLWPNLGFHNSEGALHSRHVLITVSYVVCRQYWQRGTRFMEAIYLACPRGLLSSQGFPIQPPPTQPNPRVSLCQDLFPPPLDCTAGFVPLGQLDLFSSDEGFVTEGNYFLVIRVNVPSGKTSVMTNSSSNIHSFRSFRCAPIHLIWKITHPSYLSVGQTPAPLRLETNETAVQQPESTSATWVSGSTPALPQATQVKYTMCSYSQL